MRYLPLFPRWTVYLDEIAEGLHQTLLIYHFRLLRIKDYEKPILLLQ
jgi:hypothetical protein